MIVHAAAPVHPFLPSDRDFYSVAEEVRWLVLELGIVLSDSGSGRAATALAASAPFLRILLDAARAAEEESETFVVFVTTC